MKLYNQEALIDGPNGKIKYLSFPVQMKGPYIYGQQNIIINQPYKLDRRQSDYHKEIINNLQ